MTQAPAAWARGAAAVACFVLLATLNSGGYRYGVSDQAFYQPAVLAQLDRALFPHDRTLIDAQAKLTLTDESIGLIARATGVPLPWLFLSFYLGTVGLLALAATLIARRMYSGVWTGLTLLAALTLRHAIARSGTNTLEGYFHPRQVAFAFGALAIAAFLHQRRWVPLVCVLLAAAAHPTTALWFAVWIATATFIVDRSSRAAIAIAAGAGLAAGSWALTAGPLAGRLQPMDDAWLATLVAKDYLFPLEWPAYAWVFNAGTAAIAGVLYFERRRAGVAGAHERALVAGCFSLLLIFIAAVVLQTANVALAIQLQPARTFWMFDFLATIYAVWWIVERGGSSRRRAMSALALVLAFSTIRGIYVIMALDRRPFTVDVRADDWGRVMQWARTTAKESGWLADPWHAVLYGTSVRVAGERDVFVEGVKDVAIGMYDRPVAMRTAERLAALPNFAALSAADARALASTYGLDFIVTPSTMDLPLAFESGGLRVYRLR